MTMEEAQRRLQSLEVENRLDPATVVEDARDPASPLHSFFEWDNDLAAHEHRLGQARQLIRRIKLEITVHDVPLDVCRYVRSPETPGSYRTITSVRSGSETARQVVLDEMNRVSKAARRARAVAAVLGTAEDVDEIIALAGQVVRRIDEIGATPPAGEA